MTATAFPGDLMTAHSAAAGVEIQRQAWRPAGGNPQRRGAGVSRRPAPALQSAAARAARAANGAPGRLFDAGQSAGLSPRDEIDSRRRLEGRHDPGRPSRPPGRDHRPGRPQDDCQRAELGREGLHGRFRGRLLADVRQHGRGPGQSQRSLGRQDRLHRPRDRKDLRAQEQSGGADGAPARLAFARAACRGRRRGNVRLAVRFRPLCLPLRQDANGRKARRPPFICRNSRAASKHGYGTRFSPTRSANSARRKARSRRRC